MVGKRVNVFSSCGIDGESRIMGIIFESYEKVEDGKNVGD